MHVYVKNQFCAGLFSTVKRPAIRLFEMVGLETRDEVSVYSITMDTLNETF